MKDELLFPWSAKGASQIQVDATNPVGDLVRQITAHLRSKVSGPSDPINRRNPSRALPASIHTHADLEEAFSTLTGWQQPFVRFLPNLTMVRSEGQLYTIVANRGYAYHNSIVGEDLARTPERDTLSVNRGLVGTRPELFIDMPLDKAL
jgi:hypothetical protein